MSIYTASRIAEKSGCEAPVFRRHFNGEDVASAVLDISGLGWHELYINGRAVDDTVHNPVVSTYAQLGERTNNYGIDDVFVSPRVYFCRHDITSMLTNGDNLLAVMVGNGWYNQNQVNSEGDFMLGKPSLLFSLELTKKDGSKQYIESDTAVRAGKSHITVNNLYKGETQRLEALDDFFSPEFDDSRWGFAIETPSPDGELTQQTCTPDRIIRSITPKLIDGKKGRKLYDLGENISGYIEFDTCCKGKIIIEHTEELKGGRLDCRSIGGKDRRSVDTYYADGRGHKGVHPHFNWHGFRYFTVSGEIENPVCRVIHTDAKLTSSFKCENEVVNWLFESYVRTQLSNLHGSVPSDCPHRERLGYTGDGQLCCESAMLLFETKSVYEKWIRDIFDCQCVNGHVQHTAPFFGGGGGPCGWGGAAAVVPYFYYKQFGDIELVRRYYDNIVKWFEYTEACCENGLVVREENGWCLGDWCVPDIEQGEFLPAFVNTCLLVKFYGYLTELEKALGIDKDRSKIIEAHKKSIYCAYFDRQFGNFFGNRFGANAFGLDIGLGDERTLANLVRHYEKIGYFDTGIFGTEILLRVLFERGYAELAVKLLSSRVKNHSFGYMMDSGATTLWEDYDGRNSHSHPMFGGCVKLFMQYLLGIKSTKPGFGEFIVSPCITAVTGKTSGFVTTPKGKISVEITPGSSGADILVEAYDGACGEFIYGDVREAINGGRNVFHVCNLTAVVQRPYTRSASFSASSFVS